MHYLKLSITDYCLVIAALGLLIFKVSSPSVVTPIDTEPVVAALADIEVDVDDAAKKLVLDLLTARQANVAGWSVMLDSNAVLRFNGAGIEVEGGITAKRGPVKLTLKAIGVEGDCVALKFKYGVLKVLLK